MDDRLFRDGMGKFATGVTVIVTETTEGIHGMTANAFMSLSLDPKLVLISVKNNARILPKIEEAGSFSVNILAANQEDVSKVFAGQLKDRTVEFDRLSDQPVIPGALAQIVCEVGNAHIEGDHTLFIGKVKDIALNEEDPLLFYSGKYQKLFELEQA